MKLIIAGSRHLNVPLQFIDWCVDLMDIEDGSIEEVVSGGARGVDKSGEWAADYFDIPVKLFPADWNKHGHAAGPIRNKQMAEYADALLLIWDGESKGSANMKKEMQKLNKPIYEFILKKVSNV